LLHGAGVDPGQPADGLGEVPVRAWVVNGPIGGAFGPVIAIVEAPAVPGVHEPGEDPFRLFIPVGRQGEIVVLHAGKLAEGALKGAQRTGEQ